MSSPDWINLQNYNQLFLWKSNSVMDQTYLRKEKIRFTYLTNFLFQLFFSKFHYFFISLAQKPQTVDLSSLKFSLLFTNIAQQLVLSQPVACIQLRAYKQNSVLYTRVADAKAKSQKSGEIIKIQDLIHIVNRKKWYTLPATQLGLA